MSRIREIQVSLGMSIDQKGLWTKPGITLTIALADEDSKEENRKEIVRRAFEVVEEELDRELDRLGVAIEDEAKKD